MTATELPSSRLGPRGVDVPDRHGPPARDERARGRAAVDAGADHGRIRRVGTAERLRSEHRRGARAQRGDRACLEHRLERTRLGVRDEHEAGHRRQAAGRVARERRHPLEQRVPAAERRHRSEVPGRVVRDVDLRRHRPLAAVVGDERVAHGLHRRFGRDGAQHGLGVEDRNGAQSALTPATSFSTESLASPNSIAVFGSRKSGLSIPAKPVAIERFMTTIWCAWSTFRIGIP